MTPESAGTESRIGEHVYVETDVERPRMLDQAGPTAELTSAASVARSDAEARASLAQAELDASRIIAKAEAQANRIRSEAMVALEGALRDVAREREKSAQLAINRDQRYEVSDHVARFVEELEQQRQQITGSMRDQMLELLSDVRRSISGGAPRAGGAAARSAPGNLPGELPPIHWRVDGMGSPRMAAITGPRESRTLNAHDGDELAVRSTVLHFKPWQEPTLERRGVLHLLPEVEPAVVAPEDLRSTGEPEIASPVSRPDREAELVVGAPDGSVEPGRSRREHDKAAGLTPMGLFWTNTARRVMTAVILVIILVAASLLTIVKVGNHGPSSLPPASSAAPEDSVAPAADLSPDAFFASWTANGTALAPGLPVSDQATLQQPVEGGSTRESADLLRKLSDQWTQGLSISFASTTKAPSGTDAKGRPSEASAIAYRYATTPAADAAFTTVRNYYLGSRATTGTNAKIAISAPATVRAFGFWRVIGGSDLFTAYLQYPGILVRLTATGRNVDADTSGLRQMVATVDTWAQAARSVPPAGANAS